MWCTLVFSVGEVERKRGTLGPRERIGDQTGTALMRYELQA